MLFLVAGLFVSSSIGVAAYLGVRPMLSRLAGGGGDRNVRAGEGPQGRGLGPGRLGREADSSGVRSPGTPAASGKLPRAQLLEMLFALQAELEGQKQHRAFLSVDVVGSSAMKRQGTDLAVEYSFGQFRQWVEEVVRAEGGEMQSAAGDGVMCVFPTDARAMRAARRLQEGVEAFNGTHNRLSTPFRIRCGLSAGAVAIEEGVPLGQLQSPVIDRAAGLQKQAAPGDILIGDELADVALSELGSLSRLPEPVAGSPAFSWRSDRMDETLPEAEKPD